MNASELTDTILVVDDNIVLRMHAAELLREAGYQVLEASNVPTAISMLETHSNVCLLFTDVQMPGGSDGLSLAKRVKTAWPDVLLLITSGGAKVMDESIPHDARFITKPYSDWQLLGHVRAMIGDRHTGHSVLGSAVVRPSG